MEFGRISESLRLMGLIITTKPFTYTDNVVACDYNTHVDINDLKLLKNNLQQEYDRISTLDGYDDAYKASFKDDVYFLDQVIQRLESN